MNKYPHNRQSKNRGFSAFETVIAFAMFGLLVGVSLFGNRADVPNANSQLQLQQVDVLNSVMDNYRAYLAKGYSPVTPWAATDANSLLAELSKPLVKGNARVTLMSDAQCVNVVNWGIIPSELTPNATWLVGTCSTSSSVLDSQPKSS